MTIPDCVILGGGGHAMTLIDALLEAQSPLTLGITDPRHSSIGSQLGVPLLGDDDIVRDLAAAGTIYFIVGLGSIGDTRARRRLFEFGVACGLIPLTVRHPRAIVARSAAVGDGSQILAGSIVGATARIGSNVIVNSGAIVEHECTVNDHAHISIGALVAGGITVGSGAHVGAGAVIRQCLTIGAHAVVGAGAVVTRDVAPHVTVVGVPARPVLRSAPAVLGSRACG